MAVLAVVAVPGLRTPAGADQVRLELVGLEAVGVPYDGAWGIAGITDDGIALAGSIPNGMTIAFSAQDPQAELVRPDHGQTDIRRLSPSGQAVGPHTSSESAETQVMWTDLRTGAWRVLDGPTGQYEAVAINRAGEIAGHVYTDDQIRPAFWRDAASPILVLDRPGTVVGLTDDGRVLVGDEDGYAYWQPSTGSTVDLAAPVGAPAHRVGSRGAILFYDGPTATYWDPADGTLASFASSSGSGNLPVLQGNDLVLAKEGESWVTWDRATGSTLVVDPYPGDPDVAAIDAVDVNARGQVAGRARLHDGGTRAFVWDPVAHSVTIASARPGEYLSPSYLDEVGSVVGLLDPDDGPQSPWVATFRLAPDAPPALEGEALPSAVELRWAVPEAEGDGPIERYVVRRDGAPIAEVQATATTWEGPAPDGVEHAYDVVAVNAYGESAPSPTVVLAATAGGGGGGAGGGPSLVPRFTG